MGDVEMYYYAHEDYLDDVFAIKQYVEMLIQRGHNVNVVGIHRGSLPIAVHLSNILPDVDMSIIKFQTRDGCCKEPTWLLNTSKSFDTFVVVDDIYDSGKTITEVKEWLVEQHPEQYVKPWVLFGKDNDVDCSYTRPHDGEWIVFPWELDVDSAW